jgi:hypothetical protein
MPAQESSTQQRFDVVGFVMDYESGALDEESIIEGFQRLVNSGTVWHLQGSYVRAAHEMIRLGLITQPQH